MQKLTKLAKNDKKSVLKVTDFDFHVCNAIEITATYFLMPTKSFEKTLCSHEHGWVGSGFIDVGKTHNCDQLAYLWFKRRDPIQGYIDVLN